MKWVMGLGLAALTIWSCSSNDDVAGGVTDIGNSVAYEGRVVDGSGAAVPMARVVAYYDSWNQTHIQDSVVSQTDEEGNYEIKVDSGKAVVLYASKGKECGLAKDGKEIRIGETKVFSAHIEGIRSGSVRVVGTDSIVKLDNDGYFIYYDLPQGDISLVYINDEPEARLEFSMNTSKDIIVLPALEILEENEDWITVSDYRYYQGEAIDGIKIQVPENVVVPQEPEDPLKEAQPYTITLPKVSTTVYQLMVPIKLSRSSYKADSVAILDNEGKPLVYDIEEGEKDLVAWVKIDSLTKKDTALTVNIVPRPVAHKPTTDSLTTMAWLPIDGTENLHDGYSSSEASISDSEGLFGKGVLLGKGQSIDLGTIDPCAGDFTISLWTKWGGMNGEHQILVSQRDSWEDSLSRFQWHFEGHDWKQFLVMNSSFDQGIPKIAIFDGDSIVPVGQWSYLTLTYRSGYISMHVNGERVQNKEDPFEPNELENEVSFRIGGNEIPTESWNGPIDAIRIESVARPLEWIKATYEIQKAAAGL
ncbi:MAG: hypothetical protein HUK21_03325 [Fibrobacteraceae bacterium]|nr:hypothetical protein [Fibrobacteraceae bacterium]